MSIISVERTNHWNYLCSNQLSEAAIAAAQDAIANYTTEHEIASAIKAKLDLQFPSTYVIIHLFRAHQQLLIFCFVFVAGIALLEEILVAS